MTSEITTTSTGTQEELASHITEFATLKRSQAESARTQRDLAALTAAAEAYEHAARVIKAHTITADDACPFTSPSGAGCVYPANHVGTA